MEFANLSVQGDLETLGILGGLCRLEPVEGAGRDLALDEESAHDDADDRGGDDHDQPPSAVHSHAFQDRLGQAAP
ncbi:MAG TPA: hypothetical protein VE442_18960 [Jatrophihabitans sp.]|nr:hypothetical protein [Jatrophihabitans sp.]